MYTPVRLVQPENAYSPMLVTLYGIVTFFNSLQSLNASSFILVVPSGISNSSTLYVFIYGA